MDHVAIVNLSKVTTIAGAAEVAATFWQRGRGLLGRTGLAPDGGLLIVPCSNIHMLGMQFALDVVFLDAAGRVVKLYPNLAPWRPYAGARRAHTTLELPVGVIDRSQTAVGDVVAWEPVQA